ncbi:regulatory protein GemA [Chitinivorax sp. PXF-14]|uniref:gp16 family protein n=1 Tax=Chitinivorax sp. PXF-14 TaxID=3230488 RepID=UPI003465319F
MPTKSDLAKIHIAKQQLGMDDDTYRVMLRNVAGVASSKELSAAGLARVMAHLARLGFKPTRHGQKPRMTKSRQAQIDKIEALLAEAGRPWAYLTSHRPGGRSMVQRLARVDALEWATTDGLRNIIAALMIDAERNGRPTA